MARIVHGAGRVAVTGAAGFVGSHLIRALRRDGTDALAVVREASAAGQVSMQTLLAEPSRLDGVTTLVHAAAIRHRHGASAGSYRASNVDLVEALLRASAGRVGRFVYVSSVGVYGFPATLPIDEGFPYAPRTLYSATKIEAEKLVRRLAPSLGLAYTIVRPTIVYGKGDRNGMLDKLAAMIASGRYRIVGRGENTLHHTHIDDVVRGILTLAASDDARSEDFIVAGPETVTLARLSELVARTTGKRLARVRVPLGLARAVATCVDVAAYRGIAFTEREPPVNHEKLDVMTLSIAFDPSKAARAGFVPVVRYEQGIAETLGSA